MITVRSGRFWVRLVKQLAQKYTFALIFGCILGLTGSLSLLRFGPLIWQQFFTPVEHIGLVGNVTPSTLPLSIAQLISTGLTTIAPDGSPSPALAASWETTDSGKTYIFHLRSDATWHNGKPVLAGDVNYNIKDVVFTVIDDHSLRATLKDSYSPFLTLVAKPIFQSGLRGFGPYRIGKIRLKGDAIVYLRLEPADKHISTIREYRFYRTQTQAISAYKVGDVDILEDLSSAEDIKGWGKSIVNEHTQYDRIVSIYFNLQNSRVSEKGFRQGLAYAIGDIPFERAVSPITKTSWAYTDEVKKFTHDPTQARKLLKNASAATSSAQLSISTFPPFADITQAIANAWSALGVPTSVSVANELPRDYQVLVSVQSIPPDPDQYAFWHSTQKDTNITGYVNLKVDKLLEVGRRELDTQQRKKIYADAAKRIVEDAPALFLYYPQTYTIRRVK